MGDILGIIKQKRNELDYSQEYMATKLRISQGMYSKIELGLLSMERSILYEILFILGLDAEEYFNEKAKRQVRKGWQEKSFSLK